MSKIQKVSLVLRIIFQIAFVMLPIMLVIFWLNAPAIYQIPSLRPMVEYYIPSQIEILHPLNQFNCFLGFFIDLLPTSITMLILYFLIRLFKLYEKNEIFTQQNAKYIRNIAVTMLVGQGISFIYGLLMSAAMTYNNPAGHKYAAFSFGTYDIYNILTAIMLIVISWVMLEGAKLNEEQKYTV